MASNTSVPASAKTILLVEDEALIALVERQTLERNGYDVVHVASGEKAVDVLAGGAAIDLVLMDINLGPGIDGTEAAERILQSHEVPVVFLSSHTEREIVERTERITSYGYIVKNSGDTVLLASLRMAFRLFEAHESLSKSNEMLRASQSYGRTVVETIADGFLAVDANGVIVDVNPAYCRMAGYDRDELVGTPMSRIDADDDDATVVARYEQLGTNRSTSFRTHHRRKDGAIILVDITLAKLHTDAGTVAAGFVRDVTESARLEEALEASERRFRRIMDSMQDIVFTIDAGKRHTGVYGPWVARNGLTADHFIGRTFSEILGAEAARVHESAFDRALAGEFTTYTWSLRQGDQERSFQTSLAPVADADGTVVEVVGIGRDVSSLVQAQHQLREHDRLLSDLLEQVPGAIYQYRYFPDGSSRFPFASPNIELVYEVTPAEVKHDASKVFARVHPDDLERVTESIVESYRRLSRWECEYRVVLPVRGGRWLRGLADPQRLPDGSVLWHGFIADVTELKEAESAARRNELRWQFAVEGAGDGLWDWDATTGEVYFSSRWKSMLGFEDHEITSRLEEWSERVHPDDLEHTMAALNRHLDGTTPDYASEHRLRCKDGSYKWILDRGRVVSRADDGSPVRAIGTHTDITEEKEAHRRIQRLVEEKDNLLHEVHHRIKNSFASVEALLKIGAADAAHPETRAAILAARSRVTSTRVLYETLLQAEQYETVPVHEYLTDIVHAAIAAGKATREARIDLDLQIAHMELSPRTAFPVGAIVTELVTNSLKYAFSDASEGRVGVRLDTGGSAMTITVDDDGAGFTPAQDGRNEHMHGLVLVEMMANQLDGEFSLHSEPGVGTRGTLVVPLPADGRRTVAGGTV